MANGRLRDALSVLEVEGVLKIHPRTGIQFVKPGFELTRSSFQFRGTMEAAAVTVFVDVASRLIGLFSPKHSKPRRLRPSCRENGLLLAILEIWRLLQNAIACECGELNFLFHGASGQALYDEALEKNPNHDERQNGGG